MVTPWGEVLDSVEVSDNFDLNEIQHYGELIMATISGPKTYYDYHGKSLGTQYLLVQRLADSLGVGLRVEVCRDSVELQEKLNEGQVDIVAWPTPGQLDVSPEKPMLAEELKAVLPALQLFGRIDESDVPADSVLREFIGGGIYE